MKGRFYSMANCFVNGDLYANGKSFEMKVGIGTDLKIQASNENGSCQVVGKLTANGAEKVLALINLGTLTKATTITTNDVYAADVSGFSSITVKNVTGFTKIWATITY